MHRATLRAALVVLFACLTLSGFAVAMAANVQSTIGGPVNLTGHSDSCSKTTEGVTLSFVGNQILTMNAKNVDLTVKEVNRASFGDDFVATVTMSPCNGDFTPEYTAVGCQHDPVKQVGNAQAARPNGPAVLKAINAMTWRFFAGYDASGQRVTDLFRIQCPNLS